MDVNHLIERTLCLALLRKLRQVFNLENKAFTNIDKSTTNTRLARVVLCCKCAHSANWLILFTKYRNSNSESIVNVISMQNKISTNQLSSHLFSTTQIYIIIYIQYITMYAYICIYNVYIYICIYVHIYVFIYKNYQPKTKCVVAIENSKFSQMYTYTCI